jgi:hypothetical protein
MGTEVRRAIPLHVAIMQQQKVIVRILLEKGARDQLRMTLGNTGNNALHLAVEGDQKEIAAMLLAAGAEVDHPANANGKSPVQLVRSRGMWKLLIDHLRKRDPTRAEHVAVSVPEPQETAAEAAQAGKKKGKRRKRPAAPAPAPVTKEVAKAEQPAAAREAEPAKPEEEEAEEEEEDMALQTPDFATLLRSPMPVRQPLSAPPVQLEVRYFFPPFFSFFRLVVVVSDAGSGSKCLPCRSRQIRKKPRS